MNQIQVCSKAKFTNINKIVRLGTKINTKIICKYE